MRPLFACLLVLGLVHASWADDKSDQVKREEAPFNAGDTVRVMWDRQLLTGTVVEQARVGWFKVKLNSYGTELTPVFAADRLQLVKRVQSDKPSHDESSSAAQRGSTQGTEQTVKVSPTDWSVVNNVLMGGVAAWSLKADPAPIPVGGETLTSRAVILRSTGQSQRKDPPGLGNKVGSLLFAPSSRLAFVVTSQAGPTAIPEIRVQQVELAKGQATDPVSLPVPMWPIDVDPTGKRILVATESQIAVWEFNGRTPQMVRTWIPGLAGNAGMPPQPGRRTPRRSRSFGATTLFARFIDADHVLTTASSQLVMWEVNNSRAIYKIPLPMAAVTLSPGHKYFVASLEDGLYAFEALTGKAEGKLHGDAVRVNCLAFHPDGHRLAGLDQGQFIVWNFDRGEQERKIDPTSAFLSRNNMDWVSENDILVGGRDLVDVKRGIVLWRYRVAEVPPPETKSYGQLGGSFWYLATSDRDTRALFPVVLPHEEARKKAASLNPPIAGGPYGASELTAKGIENMPLKSPADEDDSLATPRDEPRRKQ
jgi:WD40 repeat protein